MPPTIVARGTFEGAVFFFHGPCRTAQKGLRFKLESVGSRALIGRKKIPLRYHIDLAEKHEPHKFYQDNCQNHGSSRAFIGARHPAVGGFANVQQTYW